MTNTKRSQSCCFKDKQKPISWAQSLDITHLVIHNPRLVLSGCYDPGAVVGLSGK